MTEEKKEDKKEEDPEEENINKAKKIFNIVLPRMIVASLIRTVPQYESFHTVFKATIVDNLEKNYKMSKNKAEKHTEDLIDEFMGQSATLRKAYADAFPTLVKGDKKIIV